MCIFCFPFSEEKRAALRMIFNTHGTFLVGNQILKGVLIPPRIENWVFLADWGGIFEFFFLGNLGAPTN